MNTGNTDSTHFSFKGLLGFFLLFYLPVGMIASIVIMIIRISNGTYEGNLPAMISDIVYLMCYLFFGIYTIYAFAKRKGDAVFSAIFTLGLILLSNSVSLILGGTGDSVLNSASRYSSSIIITAILMFYLISSKQVKEVIPAETRKASKLLAWMMGITVLLQLVFISLTIVTSAEHQMKSLSPDEKIALMSKQMKANVDDEYVNGVRQLDVYPDSGRLVLSYRFETLKKDSISDSQRELNRIARYESTCSTLVSTGAEDPMVTALVEGGYDIEYKYLDKDGNDFISYTIPCQILASGLQHDSKYETPRETFYRAILLTNESLPVHLLNDCLLTGISMSEDGKNLIYKIVLEGFTRERLISLPTGYLKSNTRKMLSSFTDTPFYLAKFNGLGISFDISAEGVDDWKVNVSFTNDDIQ